MTLSIFVVSLIFIPRIGKGTPKTYWKIGLLWVALTIVFETILGLAMGDTIAKLLKAYDITTGNLWLLVVLFMGITPWVVTKIRQIERIEWQNALQPTCGLAQAGVWLVGKVVGKINVCASWQRKWTPRLRQAAVPLCASGRQCGGQRGRKL